MRKTLPLFVAACALALSASTASAATLSSTVYSSLPAKGTVSVPSVGVEAYSFNRIGNEVILTRSATVRRVSVTMVSWACQTGAWNTGDCQTEAGATFQTPITLTLYHASHKVNGVTHPGSLITRITKTFAVRFRPSSTPAQCGGDTSEFMGSDGVCHHGRDQNVVFHLTRQLPTDVVWGVTYNSDNSGLNPLGGSGAPQDSLNVGLAPKTTKGLARYEDSIFWDTRVQAFTCAAAPPDGNSGPFQTGVFNKDGACDGANNSWAGLVPAAKFSTTS